MIKNEKVEKIWSNGEILYLTIPQGEMKLKFTKNVKKQGKF